MVVKINRYPLGGCGNVMILLIIDESSEYRRKAVGASPKGRRSFAEKPTEYRRESDGNSPKSRNGFAKPVISWYSLRSLRLCENEFSLSFS